MQVAATYGDTGPKIIDRWEMDQEIPTVRLKHAPKRVVYPPPPEEVPLPEGMNPNQWPNQVPEDIPREFESWTVFDEFMNERNQELFELRKKSPPTSLAGKTERSEKIRELEQMIMMLEDKRQTLNEWEDEQIRRCLHGYENFTGKHYFYFHFGWIQEILDGGGSRIIHPSYRQADDWIIRGLNKGAEECRGMMAIKRRRFGMTWVAVVDIVYDMLFKDLTCLFMTYNEDDMEKFFLRCKFFHDKLPPFLRKEYRRNALDYIELFPSPRIAKVRGVEPHDLALAVLKQGSVQNERNAAGDTVGKIVIDEVGEIENVRDIMQWAVPALASGNGLDRAGHLIMFGTVGSMERAGPTIKWLWGNPEVYEVNKVFIDGTRGTYMDELGNDLQEKARKRIKHRLKVLEEAGAYSEMATQRQKFPLTIEDAFMYVTMDKVWPADMIQIAQDYYDQKKWHSKMMWGLFFQDEKGTVHFKRQEPNPTGNQEWKQWVGFNQWLIVEAPQASLFDEPYAAGCDPVDMDKDLTGGKRLRHSDITASIYKRAENSGQMTDFFVAEYTGRPTMVEDAYMQIFLACKYYDCKINIERQKGHRMIAWGHAHGFSEYIVQGAGVAMGMESKEYVEGFNSTPRWWTTMTSIGRQWWMNHYMKPISQRFIDESLFVREKNTDLVVSHLAALQYSQELDLREEMGKDKFKETVKKNNLKTRMVWRQGANGKFTHIGNKQMSARMRRELLRRGITHAI